MDWQLQLENVYTTHTKRMLKTSLKNRKWHGFFSSVFCYKHRVGASHRWIFPNESARSATWNEQIIQFSLFSLNWNIYRTILIFIVNARRKIDCFRHRQLEYSNTIKEKKEKRIVSPFERKCFQETSFTSPRRAMRNVRKTRRLIRTEINSLNWKREKKKCSK